MQKVMRGLAMLLSLAVLVLMAADLRKFIVVNKIAPFTIDSPLAFMIFVMGALAVFMFLNGIQDSRWLKARDAEGMAPAQGGKELLPIAVFTGGLFLYAYLVPRLHFLLTSFLLMGLGMFLLNDADGKVGVKLGKVLLAAGITVPVLHAIFNYAFDVVLP